nr:unnamed protein product [Haemonchus contortus]
MANLEHGIQRIEPYRSNLTPAERRGVKKLLQAKNVLRYTVGDKCGSFVVMPQTMDKALTAEVLSDDTVYEESTLTAFESVCKRRCPVPKKAFYASFDVVSLYTNVNNAGAVQAVLSLIEDNEDHITMMGFSASEVKDLIEAALERNILLRQ